MIEKYADICVVGGAGAGLCAAVKARQKGVEKVVLIDKMPAVGGCTKFAAGMFGLDSPVQKRFGYYYNVDECFREIMTVLNWEVDAKLVRKWLLGSGENIRWLEELGMEFDSVDSFNGVTDNCRKTYHMSKKSGLKTGLKIVQTLKKACEDLGVEMHMRTKATKLLRGDDGVVFGVVCEGPEGEMTIHAKAVVLATGSISANRDLVMQFYTGPEYRDLAIMADVPHNTGDGLLMAEQIGAGRAPVSTLYIGPHNHFEGASEITGGLIRRPFPIRVNRNGERVSDEGANCDFDYGWMIGVNLDKQPGKMIYGIVDQGMLEIMREKYRKDMTVCEQLVSMAGREKWRESEQHTDGGAFKEGEWLDYIEEETIKEQEAGRAKICQTLEEAAEFIGCDSEVLKKTVSDYNRYCETGYDEEFLKNPQFMIPYTKAPYYIYQGPSGIDTCIGGLKIDNYQRVLDTQSYFIPGLFAAGVMTSGWCARNYAFFGSEMSYTIYSGRTAGDNAAEYIKA